MERSCTIILILICISLYDVRLSGGEWIEVTGCHSVPPSVIQNQTSLPANEPGSCMQWCGTEIVALQNSSCLCFNVSHHNMTKRPEHCCSQICSGDEKLKCGGSSSDVAIICGLNSTHIVSVYRERTDVGTEWTSLHSSGCLTYTISMGETVEKLIPDDCTVKHPFHCYSEINNGPNNCNYFADLSKIKTWHEALEACTSPFHSYLWPAHNKDTCNGANIQSGQFWVAVYWWTKVIPTSTTSSTTTTSSATSTTSSMLSTITMSGSTTSTTYITSSTLTTIETSQSTNLTMVSPLSISGTSSTLSAITSTTATSSSPSTTTSFPTKMPNKWTNKKITYSHGSITSKNQSTSVITTLTNAPSISMTTSMSHSTKLMPSPGSHATSMSHSTKLMPSPGSHATTHGSNSLSSEMSSFKIDSPNIGLGIAIGVFAGFLISITIAYCRRRSCTRKSSRNMDRSFNSYL